MNRKINTIIAEDDELSQKVLRFFIEKYNDFEIIYEVNNGLDLLECTKLYKPELIFVDIDMPKLNGMDAAKEIFKTNPNIIIVFVTAHLNFAIEAFDIETVDYIIKPFEEERLLIALERVRKRINNRGISQIINELKSPNQLVIKSSNELYFINNESIIMIERNKIKRKSIIFTTEKLYETYESLSDLETKLNNNYFFRSHKSYIVNIKKIEKIIPWGNKTYLIKFSNSKFEAFLSREKFKELQLLLNI